MGSRRLFRAEMSAEDFGDIGFVANACASDVYRWYSQRPRERDYILWQIECSPAQNIIDYLAFRRRDPLIDLALARFGFSRTVLQRVYRRAPLSTRVALCRNPELLTGRLGRHYVPFRPERGHFTQSLVENGTDDEIRAFCSCPDYWDGVYTLLLQSFEGLPLEGDVERPKVREARFEIILHTLSMNKRMRTDRQDGPRHQYRDGGSDYDYSKPFHAAWELASHLPASRRWAELLSRLYENLPRSWHTPEEIEPLLEKWASPPQQEPEGDANHKHDPFRDVRAFLLARHFRPERSWLDHIDPAYRQAFLERYDPQALGMQEFDPLEVDLDPIIVFSQLEKNEELWRIPRGRSDIRSAARSAEYFEVRWASDRYARMEADYRAKHPDWFDAEDENFELVGDAPEPAATNLQARWIIDSLAALKRAQTTVLAFVMSLVVGMVYLLLR